MARDWHFLLSAAGLHAAGLCGVVVFLTVEPLLVAQSSHAAQVIEIDVTPLDLPRIAPTPEDAPLPASAEANLDPLRPTDPRGRTPTSPESPVAPGPVAPEADPNAHPPTDEFDPVPHESVLTVPGIGGPSVWTIPGVAPDAPRAAAAPTTAPRRREVDSDIAGQVIRDTMRAKDKSIGIELPAAGTAASAVQASLYGSDLPADARGTIAIRIGANGQVLDAKLVSMVGGDQGQWERAAQAAKSRLQGQKMDLPEAYKNGAVIYIDAVSSAALPTGKGGGFEGGGAKFDLSNIGAHRRQVVRTSTRVVAIR